MDKYIKASKVQEIYDSYIEMYNKTSITDGVHNVAINDQLISLMNHLKECVDNMEGELLVEEVQISQIPHLLEIVDPVDPSTTMTINLDKIVFFHKKSGSLQLEWMQGPIKVQPDQAEWIQINLDRLTRK